MLSSFMRKLYLTISNTLLNSKCVVFTKEKEWMKMIQDWNFLLLQNDNCSIVFFSIIKAIWACCKGQQHIQVYKLDIKSLFVILCVEFCVLSECN